MATPAICIAGSESSCVDVGAFELVQLELIRTYQDKKIRENYACRSSFVTEAGKLTTEERKSGVEPMH
jgi:hypothetical protein